MPCILVVDHAATVRGATVAVLRAAGHEVIEAASSPEALLAHSSSSVDLVLVEARLPGFDGLQLCRRLRGREDIPVIMLSDEATPRERVAGLAAGADDYLAKPADPRELALRVEAVLRRASRARGTSLPEVLVDGDLVIDHRRREATRQGKRLALTTREYDLLRFLVGHAGTTFAHQQLLRRVWRWRHGGDSRTVTVTIGRLRRKVDLDAQGSPRLVTIRGAGYRWDAALATADVARSPWDTRGIAAHPQRVG